MKQEFGIELSTNLEHPLRPLHKICGFNRIYAPE
jgi:hypothetical protein